MVKLQGIASCSSRRRHAADHVHQEPGTTALKTGSHRRHRGGYPWLFRYYSRYRMKRRPWAKAFANYWSRRSLICSTTSTDSQDDCHDSGRYVYDEETSSESMPFLSDGPVVRPEPVVISTHEKGIPYCEEEPSTWSLHNLFDEEDTVSLASSAQMNGSHENLFDWKQKGHQEDPSPLLSPQAEPMDTAENEGGSVKNHVIFEVPELMVMVAVFHHPSTLLLCGKAQVDVLYGCLNAMGYLITPSQSSEKPTPIYSSSSNLYHFLPLCSHELPGQKAEHKEAALQALNFMGIPESKVCEINKALTSRSVLAVFHRLAVKEVAYACALKKDLFGPPVHCTSEAQKLHFYRYGFCLLPPSETDWYFTDCAFSELVKELVQKALEHLRRFNSGVRILVCGGKHVGKSSLVQYMMNSLLNICSEIYHFEADPGQTEFTPSSCLSLTKVTEPMLGPPFTHQRRPEKMIALGSLNIPDIPDLYIDAATELYKYFQSVSKGQPLLVNTMGWTSGLGLNLLADLVHVIHPTHVIQLECEGLRIHNFQRYLTPEYMRIAEGWRFTAIDKQESSLDYQWLLVKSVLGSKSNMSASNLLKIAEVRKAAPLKRSLSLLAYLGQLQPEYHSPLPINGFPPYVVSWSDIAVHTSKHNIPFNQILCSLNCSLVALCRYDASSDPDGDQSLLKVLPKAPVNECFGFGIVRGIDPEAHLFYIITPEPLNVIKNVNLLLRGNTNFPEEMLLQQKACIPIPYLVSKMAHGKRNFLGKAVHRRVYRIKRTRKIRPSSSSPQGDNEASDETA